MPPLRQCLSPTTSSSPQLPPPPFSGPKFHLSSPLFPFTSFSKSRKQHHSHLHFLKPLCSSLKQTNKTKQFQKTSSAPESLRWFLNPNDNGGNNKNDGSSGGPEDEDNSAALKGTILAGVLLVGFVGGFGAVGYVYKEQINAFLTQFSGFIEGYGPAGYALFVAVYAGLEVCSPPVVWWSSSGLNIRLHSAYLILAIPAIPLTMSAGLLFGSFTGTILVSISGTVAASVAFLIARYFARERILKLVEGNKKFIAIDKAIGENGFKVVTLLRLSPLLPFSLGNYLYGLTSVKFLPYVLGSWLGMLPGTWAYVSAGAFGRAIIQEESGVMLAGGSGQLLTLGLGLLATAIAAAYVTRLAKDAMKDMD